MLFSFETGDKKFNAQMMVWRKQAALRYMIAITLIFITPVIAGMMQKMVSAEAVNSRLVSYTIGSWETTYLVVLILTLVLIEFISYVLVAISKKHTGLDPHAPMLVRSLCRKAGLEGPVRVLELSTEDKLNAGAMRSFAYGRKIILFGDMTKLTDNELEAVLAHEVAHLTMRDVRTSHFVSALLLAVKFLNFMILISLLCSLVYQKHDLTWLLLVAYVVTWVGSRFAKLCVLAYSRVCEYRADGIAVQITTDQHRRYLLSAIMKVSELGLKVMLRQHEKREIDWDKTHPSLKKRARALGFIMKNLALAT